MDPITGHSNTVGQIMDIQIRGSEYQTSLVFQWSKRDWMPNGLLFRHQRRFSVNRRDLQALTLAGPTVTRLKQDPLAV